MSGCCAVIINIWINLINSFHRLCWSCHHKYLLFPWRCRSFGLHMENILCSNYLSGFWHTASFQAFVEIGAFPNLPSLCVLVKTLVDCVLWALMPLLDTGIVVQMVPATIRTLPQEANKELKLGAVLPKSRSLFSMTWKVAQALKVQQYFISGCEGHISILYSLFLISTVPRAQWHWCCT